MEHQETGTELLLTFGNKVAISVTAMQIFSEQGRKLWQKDLITCHLFSFQTHCCRLKVPFLLLKRFPSVHFYIHDLLSDFYKQFQPPAQLSHLLNNVTS